MILEAPEGSKLLLADFVQLDEAQQRRLIRAAVALTKGNLRPLEFDHVERVRQLALSGKGRVEIPQARVERRREKGVEFLIFLVNGP
jgi:hypothetical protein